MAVRDLGLQYWPQQVEKVRQLYNQVMVRHGVMLVGPTGGGKTTTRNILQRALVLLPMIVNDEEKRRASKVDKRRSSTVRDLDIYNILQHFTKYEMFLYLTIFSISTDQVHHRNENQETQDTSLSELPLQTVPIFLLQLTLQETR